MLVICPECGAEISSKTEVCLKCGLPEAGKKSKEYHESCLAFYKKEAGEVKYDRSLKCLKCGYTSVRWKRTKSELIKKEDGYDHISGDVYCPKCGASWQEAQWADEVTSVDNQKPKGLPRCYLICFLIVMFIIILILILKNIF